MHAHVHHVCTCNRWTLVTKYMHFLIHVESKTLASVWQHHSHVQSTQTIVPVLPTNRFSFTRPTNEQVINISMSQLIKWFLITLLATAQRWCLWGAWGDWEVNERSQSRLLPLKHNWLDVYHDAFLAPIMPFFFHALCKWHNSASVSATPDNTIFLKQQLTFHIRKYEGYRWRTAANQDCNFKPEHLPVMLLQGTKTPQTQPTGVMSLRVNAYSQKMRQGDWPQRQWKECGGKVGVNCQVPWGNRGQWSQLFLFFLFLDPGVPLRRVSCAEKHQPAL